MIDQPKIMSLDSHSDLNRIGTSPISGKTVNSIRSLPNKHLQGDSDS